MWRKLYESNGTAQYHWGRAVWPLGHRGLGNGAAVTPRNATRALRLWRLNLLMDISGQLYFRATIIYEHFPGIPGAGGESFSKPHCGTQRKPEACALLLQLHNARC